MRLRSLILAIVVLGFVTAELAAQQQTGAGLQGEIVIARSVEDRKPVDPGKEFPADVGQLVAWTMVTGAANTTITHVWRYKEHEVVIPLSIGGSPWRVWSRKSIPSEWTGQWTLEVRDAAGTAIATTTFTVGGQ